MLLVVGIKCCFPPVLSLSPSPSSSSSPHLPFPISLPPRTHSAQVPLPVFNIILSRTNIYLYWLVWCRVFGL